jgi:uncharacterized alkaline shock family protein YloU
MNENTKTNLGEIKIHKNVFATIAIEATKEIPGVVRMGYNLRTYFLNLLGQKDISAIKIEFDKNNEAKITVPIVVEYGYNVPDVASKVQENVKMAIENATSIDIKDINVVIQEIGRKQ